MSTFTYRIFQSRSQRWQDLYHPILDSVVTYCRKRNPDLSPKEITDALRWSSDLGFKTWSSEPPAWITSSPASDEINVYTLVNPRSQCAVGLAVAVGTSGTRLVIDRSLEEFVGVVDDWTECVAWLQRHGWLNRAHLTRRGVPATETAWQHAVRNGCPAALRSLIDRDD